MTEQTRTRPRRLIPAALILLSAVPVVAGTVRLTGLATNAPVTAENARFVAAPLPVVLHIVGATVFCLFGAFQFVPHRRHSARHRAAGRLLVPCGLVAALSGLWMTLFYPHPPGHGVLLGTFRIVFGSLMAVALVLGFTAIRRRRFAAHRAWMIRGYALGVAAGTQAVVSLLWLVLVGPPGELTGVLLLGAGWVVNLAVAERIIRAKPRNPNRNHPATIHNGVESTGHPATPTA